MRSAYWIDNGPCLYKFYQKRDVLCMKLTCHLLPGTQLIWKIFFLPHLHTCTSVFCMASLSFSSGWWIRFSQSYLQKLMSWCYFNTGLTHDSLIGKQRWLFFFTPSKTRVTQVQGISVDGVYVQPPQKPNFIAGFPSKQKKERVFGKSLVEILTYLLITWSERHA